MGINLDGAFSLASSYAVDRALPLSVEPTALLGQLNGHRARARNLLEHMKEARSAN